MDVAGDAVSSQRQYCQETENVVFINRNSGGISSEVDECAARTAFALGQHGIGCYQWRDQLVGNIDLCLLEAVFQILPYGRAGDDIEETSFDVASYQSHRVGLQIIADFVFLRRYVQYIHIDYRNRYVLIADSVYQLFRDNRFFFEVATYYVADCAEGLSANAYVYLGD